MDHLHTLNDLTPKVRCEGKAGVDPSLIFGLDSQLFQLEERRQDEHQHSQPHHHEVQTLTIVSKMAPESTHIEKTLQEVSKEAVYRIKGFLRLENESRGSQDQGPSAPNSIDTGHRVVICNWAFGRFEFTPYPSHGALQGEERVRLTVMGERGSGAKLAVKQLAAALGGEVVGA